MMTGAIIATAATHSPLDLRAPLHVKKFIARKIPRRLLHLVTVELYAGPGGVPTKICFFNYLDLRMIFRSGKIIDFEALTASTT